MVATSDAIIRARELGVGPGKIPAGTRVMCLPGSLPRSEGAMRLATVVSVGPKATRVKLFGEDHERRVDNTLLILDNCAGYPEAYGIDPLDRPPPHGAYTYSRCFGVGRWRPRFAWMSWTVAQHLKHAAGKLPLPTGSPFTAPKRLVIVGCGGKKADRKSSDAHSMYVGSYHLACRRAADALVARSPGEFNIGDGVDTYQMILSAKYGLLDLFTVINTYDLRMGEPDAVGADTVAYQASQFGLLGTPEVIVLAGKAYADVVSAVWPHAIRPLDGTAGMFEQMAVLAEIARTGELPAPKEATVASKARSPHWMAMRYPAALRAGDVFVHPERGQLTFVSSTVASSARPTVARITVEEGEPFETDAFHGPQFEIVSRGSVDPVFADANKSTPHLYVPLTNERTRCGECGRTNTPDHILGPIGSPGGDVPIDFSPLLDPPAEQPGAVDPEEAAVVPPGAVIRCRCAKRAKVLRNGTIGKHGRHACGMVGQVPPPDMAVLSLPADAPPADLFTGLAAFGAMVANDLGLTAAPTTPRVIPLADAEWGMYGEVKGYGPTGDRRTEQGYITTPPRITTRGFSSIGRTRKRKGDRLLWFHLTSPPPAGQRGGSGIGMYAEENATFTVLDAPADHPLTDARSLSRRMPVEDLRARDVFYIWNEPGHNPRERTDTRPRYHVQEDPRPVGDGQYELAVLVDGQVTTRTYHGDTYADVEDPEKVPWMAAPEQPEAIAVPDAPSSTDPESLYARIHAEATDLLSTCDDSTDAQLVVWSVGVFHVAHAFDLGRYVRSRTPGDIQGGTVGGTFDGRGYTADARGFHLYRWDRSGDGPDGYTTHTVAKVTWKKVAQLLDQALEDPTIAQRAAEYEQARLHAFHADKDMRAVKRAEDAGRHLVAQMWERARPRPKVARSRPAATGEPLPLFDLATLGAAVDAALASK